MTVRDIAGGDCKETKALEKVELILIIVAAVIAALLLILLFFLCFERMKRR